MRKKLFYDKDDFYLIPFKDYWKVIQNQKEIGHMQMILNALIFINFMREFFDYDYRITNFKSDQAIINLSFQKAKDNKSVMDFFINELVDAYTNLNFDRIDFITVEKDGMITTIHSNGVVETQDHKAEQIIIKNLNKTIKRSAMDWSCFFFVIVFLFSVILCILTKDLSKFNLNLAVHSMKFTG